MNEDYSDMLSAFAAEAVEYLLIGAYAVAVHGFPRATGDIDLWIRPTAENARRVMAALERFGAPTDRLTVADLSSADLIFQIGLAPCRIDLFTQVKGIEFDEVWPSRVETELAGVPVVVIGREDLIRAKRAAGRPQDQADVARLLADGGER